MKHCNVTSKGNAAAREHVTTELVVHLFFCVMSSPFSCDFKETGWKVVKFLSSDSSLFFTPKEYCTLYRKCWTLCLIRVLFCSRHMECTCNESTKWWCGSAFFTRTSFRCLVALFFFSKFVKDFIDISHIFCSPLSNKSQSKYPSFTSLQVQVLTLKTNSALFWHKNIALNLTHHPPLTADV